MSDNERFKLVYLLYNLSNTNIIRAQDVFSCTQDIRPVQVFSWCIRLQCKIITL